MDHGTQHWVPSSYLEPWCDPDRPPNYSPCVWRFAKDGGEGQRKAPHNIFAETDFYTTNLPDGQRDLSMEHGLATIEENFCRIRKTRINRREPLTSEEKAWFCLFVAAMRFRTRAQRNAFQAQAGHVVRVAEDLQHALDAMTPEQLQQYLPPRTVGKTIGPPLTIDDFKKLAAHPLQHMLKTIIEEDMPVLYQMNLVIFTTEDEIGFITSDGPCAWYDPRVRRGWPTLQSRTIEVSMPVSPNSLAFLCWHDVPTYMSMDLCGVDCANGLRRLTCDEHLVVRVNATKPVWFT